LCWHGETRLKKQSIFSDSGGRCRSTRDFGGGKKKQPPGYLVTTIRMKATAKGAVLKTDRSSGMKKKGNLIKDYPLGTRGKGERVSNQKEPRSKREKELEAGGGRKN